LDGQSPIESFFTHASRPSSNQGDCIEHPILDLGNGQSQMRILGWL